MRCHTCGASLEPVTTDLPALLRVLSPVDAVATADRRVDRRLLPPGLRTEPVGHAASILDRADYSWQTHPEPWGRLHVQPGDTVDAAAISSDRAAAPPTCTAASHPESGPQLHGVTALSAGM